MFLRGQLHGTVPGAWTQLYLQSDEKSYNKGRGCDDLHLQQCGASYTRAIAKLEEIPSTEQKPAQGAAADGSQNEPFVAEDSEKSGWQMISKQLEQTPAGDIVEIDMNGATTVPSTLFEQVKGKDVQIVFQMGDGICWTVDGRDVTDIRGDIDFGVTFGSDAGKNIPVDVINQVTGEQYSVNLTLAYSGEFGFSATLTVNLEKKNVGYYANLFYYNPEQRCSWNLYVPERLEKMEMQTLPLPMLRITPL